MFLHLFGKANSQEKIMDQSFHYMMMVTNTLFQKKAIVKLAEVGLTPGQPKILDYLKKHNGCMQKEIAHGCQIDPATTTGVLSRMEEKGLIERRIMNGNHRSSYVFMTNKGNELAKNVCEIFQQLEEEVLGGIDEKERRQFLETLYRICANMTNTEELQ